MNGRLMSVSITVESSIFAFSAASGAGAPSGPFDRSMPGLLELGVIQSMIR
jgi:hypothetical protein